MKLEVTDKAIQWFKEEVLVEEGSAIRFYVKIYGTSPIREGYALAFEVHDEAIEGPVGEKIEQSGLTFYVKEDDLWFFEGHNLVVDYDEKMEEVAYRYPEIK
ncbi:MAG: HesB/YadR/YfhF family protein [Bacillota bacterium]